MFNTIKTFLTVFAFSAAVTVNQDLALDFFPGHGHGHNPGHSGPVSAPELDASGSLAVLALLVSVGLVLFNRSRNR